MSLLPQINNEINSSVKTEVTLPSKTYRLKVDSTALQLQKGNKTTVSGSEIKLTDVKFTQENKTSIKLKGSTSQVTRSGKNLLKSSNNTQTINGVTFTVNTDGSITANGTSGASKTVYQVNRNTPLNANTKYTLSGCSNGSTSTYLIQVALNKNGTKRYLSNSVNPVTFTASEQEIAEVYIIIYENATVNNVTFYPQIEEGSVATDYEQYGVMPSPDYPSPIENVAGKNKFDINQEKEVFGTMLYKYSYYLKPNTKYTISSNCPASTTANIYANSNSSNSAVYINKNQTIQSDENGYFYILVRFKADASDNSTFNLYEKVLNGTYYIQLEEGTVATDYVPYNSLEIKDVGENLFNPNNAKDGFVDDNNGQILGVNNIQNKNTGYIKIDGGEKYFILSNKLSGNWGAWYDKDKRFISGMALGGVDKGIVTAPNNAYFINFTVSYNNNNPDYANNVMIARSDKEIPYKPYQEQKVTFPLSEGQKLYEGSYLADDGIHHSRKQVVLDGSEAWSKDPNTEGKTDYFYIKNIGITENNINNVFCTHFVKGALYTQGFWATTVFCITINKEYTGIVSTDTRDERIAKFKNWLATQYANGTPVIVEYELAEPETVPYTAEQQEAYNQLNDYELFDGVNYITMISTIPGTLSLAYYDKNNINLIKTEEDRIVGFVDNLEAVKQSIYHILSIERYAYLIYDDNYGVEFEQYIGKDFDYINATIENTLQEALLYDLRILDVSVDNIEQIDINKVAINFTVDTIYGNLVMEVSIDV
jgi:hypothetical protein